MAYVKIEDSRCKGCELCVEACPKDIMQINQNKTNESGYFVVECIDNDKCIGCKFCAYMCPDMVIEVFK